MVQQRPTEDLVGALWQVRIIIPDNQSKFRRSEFVHPDGDSGGNMWFEFRTA